MAQRGTGFASVDMIPYGMFSMLKGEPLRGVANDAPLGFECIPFGTPFVAPFEAIVSTFLRSSTAINLMALLNNISYLPNRYLNAEGENENFPHCGEGCGLAQSPTKIPYPA